MTRRADAQKTRQVILMTAFQEVHKNGFRATALNDILNKTGLTKGAFYHHFPNKAALGNALVEEVLEWMVLDIWLGPLEDAEDPIECLQDMLLMTKTDYDSVCLGCPLNNMAVEMAPVDEDIRRRVNRAYDLWVDGYARALEAGKEKGFVREDVDAHSTALFIVSSMAGCRSVAKNARDRETLLQCHEHLAAYLDTLRP